jgi:catechol 2,3-dioxygenase-like lactoylglutathione lyase family enzyme
VKRTWTIIGVGDVAKSFKWYQALLGLPETAPAHDYFGQIVDSDGTVLLCLHEWGAHEHPSLTSPDDATPGNGSSSSSGSTTLTSLCQGRARSWRVLKKSLT